MGFLREPTIEEKANKVEGFSVEQTNTGYTVKGVDAYAQPATWQLDASQANNLLDHVRSVQIGMEYRQEKYDLEPGQEDTSSDWCERKHEIREHRLQAIEEENKPGWKRL